jgi:iron complex outermembrane receptor protein
MRLFFFILFCSLSWSLSAQDIDTGKLKQRDTITEGKSLDEVVVQAFNTRMQWKKVPAAVAVISSADMNRYANTSLVPVMNTIPGIRMEERSPASYRLSIRGSLLRSPFGVRNVKVYWNEIPLTDAGGNTYLNIVDMNELTGAELIKGPAASVYGAGTGGALLLQSDQRFSSTAQDRFTAGITGASYGLFGEQAGWQHSNDHFTSSLQQTHQQSDGFREQSASRKDILKWQGNWQLKKQAIQFIAFYADIYYQTPGGITLAQMQLNPTLSRQTAGAIPGSVQQKASIYNKTIFGGLHHEAQLSDHFVLKTFLTGNHTAFTNPFITNYEKRVEANFGVGTNLIYQIKTVTTSFQWMNGAEWLANHSAINDFGNRSGVADTVQFKDDVFAKQWFAFSQAQYVINDRWSFTAGLSLNNQLYRYKRLTDPASAYSNKSISMILTPRVAALYRLTKDISLYTLAAKGFSPPALAEVRPSDGNYYGDLNAEYGWNFETGIKGELFDQRLQFDVAAYFFALQNAIVRRNNVAGAEYFVNAGGTKQNGLEAFLKYQLIDHPKATISKLTVRSSYSYQPYRFDDYRQTTNNYSGNELTGVPRNIWVSGLDMETSKGFYLDASLNCTSRLPLTDANDAYADAYQLLQVKLGYRCNAKDKKLDVFFGIDNLLDQNYSLGNDINAAGKRYYNPAAGRNVFSGFIYRF